MGGFETKKIGVLGGGQLGKMLSEAAHPMGIKLHLMDQSDAFPAAKVNPFFKEGNFKNYQDVVNFGKDKDILTIEIESVNTEALHYLEKNGIKVYPQPAIIDLIKDKGLQKQFYQKNKFPSSAFQLFDDEKAILKAIDNGKLSIPFVQKARTGGYDGRGVHVVNNESDLEDLLPVPSIIEELVNIKKEIAVIVARNPNKETKAFPAVEMKFHPTANLVEMLFSPSTLNKELAEEAEKLAVELANKLKIVGLLAVEMFLDNNGQLLINEVAPRPHNSGHHTIEANITSQYQQHLRAILNLPLGDPSLLCPAAMFNLLGEPGYSGKAIYEGMDKALAISGVYIHIYGKETSSPWRKMGHVTLLDKKITGAKAKANSLRSVIKVKGNKEIS